MLAKALRALAWVAYAIVVVVVFLIAGYFSFSRFVRSGVTPVPDLVGLVEEEANASLMDHGLRLRRDRETDRASDEVPAGRVLQQSPTSGSLVKRGSGVEVVLSLGPELLEVPDLTGRALQAAQVTLAAAGLSIGRTDGIYADGAQPGTVVDQEPPAGALVGRSTPVALYLCIESPADTFLMPDLAYRDLDVVRVFFERSGFRLGSVKFETYEGISPGVVLRQFPLPGHPIRRRDVISLVVTAQEQSGA